MIVVSVPGKIHLMGEHAVVYGKPALLSAINLRLSVTIENGTNGIEIMSSEPIDHARYAVDFLLEQLKIKDHGPIKITINSQIPASFHLGSSAAVAVGLTGALTYFFKKIWNPIRINELAYEIEKKQHGNPSGGDNTAVTMGGFIWFRKELEFLKSMWQLPFKPHPSVHHFFLINTGRPKETTGEMVRFVKSQITNHKSQIENLMNVNELQTKRVVVALKEGNEKELVDAIRIGERTLEGMGVVSRKVIPLIRDIEKTGGAAKILGGGGRKESVGFLLCYHHDPKKFKAIPVQLGGEGVRLEVHD